jgi:RHS repeat-associated protein
VKDFQWDAEGRLTGLTNNDGVSVSYLYDAAGQLVGEALGTNPLPENVTRYLPDKNLAWSQILEERDGSGNLKVAYTYADTLLLKQERGGATGWYQHDHLSPRTIVDNTGAPLNRYHFSPFGEIQRQDGPTIGTLVAMQNGQLFAGERFDANLNMYYLRARYMDPRLGRFAGMDMHPGTLRSPMSLHDYVYASNDPIGMIDPTGHSFFASIGPTLIFYSAPIIYIAQQAAPRILPFAANLGANIGAWGNGVYRLQGFPNLRIAAGQAYERVLTPAMRILRADGPDVRGVVPGARPDWMFGLSHIVEAKLGQYVNPSQLQAYINYIQALGHGRITYITLTRVPPQIEAEIMRRASQAGVEVKIIWIMWPL